MTTETISGNCPCCGYDKVIQHYGSLGRFHADLCVNCGFAYGTNQHDWEGMGVEHFKGWMMYYLEAFEVEFDQESSTEVLRKLLFDELEKNQERYDDVESTVFNYTEEDIIFHQSFNLPVFKNCLNNEQTTTNQTA